MRGSPRSGRRAQEEAVAWLKSESSEDGVVEDVCDCGSDRRDGRGRKVGTCFRRAEQCESVAEQVEGRDGLPILFEPAVGKASVEVPAECVGGSVLGTVGVC